MVENQAGGVLDCFSMDGNGFPGRSLCCGDIWKRHGSVGGDCDEGWDEGDFQG